ncbi:hypothetical protein [Acetobacter persici]|uniref:Uncharacterized protein n=1 Tax=Acetobacter persici TaxID=1076596 RepID=A0A1U9LJW8_9PROT|nr:hypothetical protein [Acetobacter persici]AQT06698.1 hypothetical protein A0U91_16990 [Acetobacter persici]
MAKAKNPVNPVKEAESELLTAFMVMGMAQEEAKAAVAKTIEVFVEKGRREERKRLLPEKGISPEVCSVIDGLQVSMDVSSCGVNPSDDPNEAGYRYFGAVAEVMGASDSSRDDITLLVYDSSPNFSPSRPGDSVILNWLLSHCQANGMGRNETTYAMEGSILKRLQSMKGDTARDALLNAMPAKLRRKANGG